MDQKWTLWSDIISGHHIAIRQRQTSRPAGSDGAMKFIEIDGKEVPREKGQTVLTDAGRFDVIERYGIDAADEEPDDVDDLALDQQA